MSKELLSNAAFGCDPVFLPSSPLYSGSAKRAPYYDEKELNPLSLTPFGFYHLNSQFGFDAGFHVAFDCALSQHDAELVLEVLTDGFFLDAQTSGLRLVVITYHGVHNMLAALRISWDFSVGGEIVSSWELQTFALDPYIGDIGAELMRMECVVAAMIVLSTLSELYDFVVTTEILRAKFLMGTYFKSFWNYCDVASVCLLLLLLVRRLTYIREAALLSDPAFIDLDFRLLNDSTLSDSKDSLEPRALRLHADMFNSKRSFFKFLAHIESLGSLQSNYQLILGMCTFLLMLRLVHAFDFQARMGILTRTLSRAVVDLLHFGVLFLMIILMYAALGTILFGHQVGDYIDMAASVQTLLRIVATGDGYSDALVKASSHTIASIFFWSFVVVIFFILMNIFLAIVVDAFVEVKSETKHDETVPADLFFIGQTVVGELFNGARSLFWRRVRPSLWQCEQAVQKTLKRRPRRKECFIESAAIAAGERERVIESGVAKIHSQSALLGCLDATHVSAALGADDDGLSRTASLLFEQFSERVVAGAEVTASEIVQLKLVEHMRDTQAQLSRMAATDIDTTSRQVPHGTKRAANDPQGQIYI